jgi:hypothetical protein
VDIEKSGARARRFRATLCGDGRPGPIEERIGRRRVRLIDPETAEGRRLARDQRVEWVGPDGTPLGCVDVREAYRALLSRLERRLQDEPEPRQRELEEGRDRLLRWSTRLIDA